MTTKPPIPNGPHFYVRDVPHRDWRETATCLYCGDVQPYDDCRARYLNNTKTKCPMHTHTVPA